MVRFEWTLFDFAESKIDFVMDAFVITEEKQYGLNGLKSESQKNSARKCIRYKNQMIYAICAEPFPSLQHSVAIFCLLLFISIIFGVYPKMAWSCLIWQIDIKQCEKIKKKSLIKQYIFVVAATKKRETCTWIKCDLVKSNISCLDHHILKGGKNVGFLDVMLLVKRKLYAEKKNDKRWCQEAFGFVCIVTNSDRLTLCLSIIPMIQQNVLQFIKPTFCWVFIFYASSLSNSHIKQWIQIELGILYICIHMS